MGQFGLRLGCLAGRPGKPRPVSNPMDRLCLVSYFTVTQALKEHLPIQSAPRQVLTTGAAFGSGTIEAVNNWSFFRRQIAHQSKSANPTSGISTEINDQAIGWS
jgi:hypothetical protein